MHYYFHSLYNESNKGINLDIQCKGKSGFLPIFNFLNREQKRMKEFHSSHGNLSFSFRHSTVRFLFRFRRRVDCSKKLVSMTHLANPTNTIQNRSTHFLLWKQRCIFDIHTKKKNSVCLSLMVFAYTHWEIPQDDHFPGILQVLIPIPALSKSTPSKPINAKKSALLRIIPTTGSEIFMLCVPITVNRDSQLAFHRPWASN